MIEHMRAIARLLAVVVIASEPQRSREWNGLESCDMDERQKVERTGSERIKSLE